MGIEQCLEYICDWYYSDTIELIDLVLCDDNNDPQYSAITALNRLWVYLQYKQQSQEEGFDKKDLFSLIEDAGYPEKVIEIIKQKARDELEAYTGDVLIRGFLED